MMEVSEAGNQLMAASPSPQAASAPEWECPAWDDASLAGCRLLPSDLVHMLPYQCPVCYRNFKSAGSLDTHLSSGAHQAKSVKCPKCARGFKSASACTQHIESRACVDISRQQIVCGVKAWELRTGNVNLLTLPRLAAHHLSHRAEAEADSDDSESEEYSQQGGARASEAAYDGWAYRCCVCDATFATLLALNQHLNSAAHEAQEYRCKKCGVTCILLSALIQHVESRVCGAASGQDQGYELEQHFPRLCIQGGTEPLGGDS